MADFLETAPVVRQRIAFGRDKQLSVRQRRRIGTGDEITHRHLAPAAFGHEFYDRIMSDQARRHICGRRSVDDIAADRRLRTNLIVREPYGTARHFGQRAAKGRVIEKPLDWCCRAKTDPVVSDLPLIQLRNFRDVYQHRNVDVASPALARPRQRVGRTRDDTIAAVIDPHRGKRLVERLWCDVVIAS